MPNLVPVSTFLAVRERLHSAIVLHQCIDALYGLSLPQPQSFAPFSAWPRTVKPRDYSRNSPMMGDTGTDDAAANVHRAAMYRLSLPLSDRFSQPSGYEEPSHCDKPETRKGSRLTRPDLRADGCDDIEAAHGGHSDARIRYAQWLGVTGIKGFAVLNRAVTAACHATHNVPVNLSGLPPLSYQSPEGDTLADVTTSTLSLGELRQMRKYRNAMKGESFAASVAREQRERDAAFWRTAFPWWPLNKDGSRKAPLHFGGTFHFDMGKGDLVPMADLIARHKAHVPTDDAEQVEAKRKAMQRKAELDALIAEHKEDAADQRAREKRQRAAREKNKPVTGRTLLRFRK